MGYPFTDGVSIPLRYCGQINVHIEENKTGEIGMIDRSRSKHASNGDIYSYMRMLLRREVVVPGYSGVCYQEI